MRKILVLGAAVLMLAGCSSMPFSGSSSSGGTTPSQARAIEKQIRERADYWQRGDRVSAQYMVGPKAQHQLHTDIASCVAEVRELVRLGSIRNAQPPKGLGMDPEMRSGWTSVTRNGPLYMEYTPFQDFDGCMVSKGWERVDFVKPVIADRAAQNYNGTITGMTAGLTPRTTARYDSYGTDQRTSGGYNN